MLSKIINDQKINMQAIIEMVLQHHPERKDVISGLQNAVGGNWKGKAYFQFVTSANANMPGAEWQHDDCIVLDQVDIVIDLLKDGRIGGIEFLSLLD